MSKLAALRGVGEGASGGLIKYPAASLMFAIDKLMGEGKLTYTQALAELRAQREQDVQDATIAHTAGTIAGSMLPLAAIAKGGAGLGKIVAGNAALGAAQGFSSNAASEGSTLQDTLVGAGVGGTLGLLGGGASAAAQKLARVEVQNTLYNRLMADPTWKEAAKTQLKKDGVKTPKHTDIERFARSEANATAQKLSQRELPAYIDSPKSSLPTRLWEGTKRATSGVVPSAITGGVVGGTGALLTGQDPVSGAMLGAGGAVALAKQGAMANMTKTASHTGGRILARTPALQNAPLALSPGATSLIVPGMVQGAEPAAPGNTNAERFKETTKPAGKPDDFSDIEQFRVKPSAKASAPDDFSDLEEFRVR